MHTTHKILPAHWASAIINDDLTSLTEDEADLFNAFVEGMIDEYGQCWAIDYTNESTFTKYHDAQHLGVLACDCKVFQFDITEALEAVRSIGA